jgi:hypothetical protein
MYLFEEIWEFMDNDDRLNKVPALIQFLAALNFYGTGNFQTSVGQDLNIALSQPVVSRNLNKISDIFTNHLLARYVKYPVIEENMDFKINCTFLTPLVLLIVPMLQFSHPRIQIEIIQQ